MFRSYTDEQIAEKTARARELYSAGGTVKAIAKILQVNHARISQWCEDLVKKRLIERFNRSRVKKPEGFDGYKTLSDDQVIAMRKEVRAIGVKHWELYAERYTVSLPAISRAMRGVTFTHLNEIEPPISEGAKTYTPNPAKNGGRYVVPRDLVEQMVELRRSDPTAWGFVQLVEWLKARTGRNHTPNTTATMLYNFDPSLRDIKVKPVKPVRERKVVDAETLERKRQEKNARARLITKELAYERWVNSGKAW